MQISRHWRLNSTRYRLEGTHYHGPEVDGYSIQGKSGDAFERERERAQLSPNAMPKELFFQMIRRVLERLGQERRERVDSLVSHVSSEPDSLLAMKALVGSRKRIA